MTEVIQSLERMKRKYLEDTLPTEILAQYDMLDSTIEMIKEGILIDPKAKCNGNGKNNVMVDQISSSKASRGGLPPRMERKPNGKPDSIHTQTINFILGLIEQKGSAVTIPDIWEQMKDAPAFEETTKQGLTMILSNEVNKVNGSRLKRVMHGMYDKALPITRVKEDRSKEEIEEQLRRARVNAER
jgi:hypothetical protein